MAQTDARTGLEFIDEQECWELLRSEEIGRLATCIDGSPEIFPINYKVDGERLVFNTVPGLKLASLLVTKEIAFEIDSVDRRTRSAWSVVVHGKARELVGLEELMEAKELGIEPWTDSQKLRYFEVSPRKLAGRRIPAR